MPRVAGGRLHGHSYLTRLHEVFAELGLDPKRFPPRAVHATISAARNDHVSVDAYAARAGVIYERKIADIYREYQALLQRAGAMDFDDLLDLCARALEQDSAFATAEEMRKKLETPGAAAPAPKP